MERAQEREKRDNIPVLSRVEKKRQIVEHSNIQVRKGVFFDGKIVVPIVNDDEMPFPAVIARLALHLEARTADTNMHSYWTKGGKEEKKKGKK